MMFGIHRLNMDNPHQRHRGHRRNLEYLDLVITIIKNATDFTDATVIKDIIDLDNGQMDFGDITVTRAFIESQYQGRNGHNIYN
jgi:hypothetical protein